MKKIFLSLIFLSLFLISACSNKDVLSYNLREHKNLVMHIHPTVEIYIEGEKQIIPANIGISNTGMRVIHTHDSSGILHVESPVPHQFFLKDFFTIWEKQFSNSCIFDYCEDETHQLTVLVNGVESTVIEDVPLMDKDLIQIFYEEKTG